jgi:hypothetical protein
MAATLYRFACPLCGTPIDTTATVNIRETHTADGSLVAVRIRGGSELLHQCEATSSSALTDRISTPPLGSEADATLY